MTYFIWDSLLRKGLQIAEFVKVLIIYRVEAINW